MQPSLPTLKILVPLTSWHQKFRRKKPSAGSKYEWQYKIVSPAFCYVELWSKMYLCWAQTFSCPDAQKFGTYASQCDLSQLRPSFEFDIWLATCIVLVDLGNSTCHLPMCFCPSWNQTPGFGKNLLEGKGTCSYDHRRGGMISCTLPGHFGVRMRMFSPMNAERMQGQDIQSIFLLS